MLTIGGQIFETEKIYNIGDVREKNNELGIESGDIKEIVLWGSEAIDLLVGKENYGVILENKQELQKFVKFILENSGELKNTEIKDREGILKK